jgi:hypothetical protein
MKSKLDRAIEQAVSAGVDHRLLKKILISSACEGSVNPDKVVAEINKVLAGDKYKSYVYDKHYYRFVDHDGQFQAFQNLMRHLVEDAYIYYTSDIEAGIEVFDKHKHTVDIEEAQRNASLELDKMISEAIDIVGTDKTKQLLIETAEIEPMGPVKPENAIMHVPVGDIVIDPHGIAGKINQKPVPDLYATLGEGLYEDEIESLSVSLKAAGVPVEWDWKDTDKIEIPTRWDYWAATVNEDRFASELAKLKSTQKVEKIA